MGMCADGNCPECQKAREKHKNDPEWQKLSDYLNGIPSQNEKTLQERNSAYVEEFLKKQGKKTTNG